MTLTNDQLAKAIVASGVMQADELKAFWSELSMEQRPKDGETFAKLLVEQQKLNEFQASELLSGSQTPLVLGDYVLQGKIGAGGMGQVFKAHHRHMERMAAIKLLPHELTKDTESVKRFQREVKAAAKLSHPNIVQTHDASNQRGVWYLVMEYVDGRDLAETVAAQGPLPIATAINYIRQAARGLTFAHKNGVVHRDIKPANLLVDKEGTIKILDMGLARLDDGMAAAKEGLTQSGQVMGTVDYMAPEQAFDTRHADARADIYSLGCTLYRLLTAQNMYEGESLVQKLMAHQTKPIPVLSKVRADIPAALNSIFAKMVAKQPADRYQTMAEVETALAALDNPTALGSPSNKNDGGGLTGYFKGLLGGKPEPTSAGVGVLSEPTAPHLQPLELVPTVSLANPLQSTDPVSDRSIQLVQQSSTRSAGAKKPPAKWSGKKLLGAGFGGLLCIALAGLIIIKVTNKDGNVSELKVPEDSVVEVTDAHGKTVIVPSTTEKKAPVAKLDLMPVSPDALTLIAGNVTNTFSGLLPNPPAIPGVKRWNVETRTARAPGGTAWSPDSRYVAVANGRQLRIYEAPHLKLVRVLPEHSDWIGSVAWSPDGKWIASVDNTVVRLHNPVTGEAGPVLQGHTKRIGTIAWSGNSKSLATGSHKEPGGNGVLLWTPQGEIVGRISMDEPNALLWHPSEPLLLARNHPSWAIIWDTKQLKQLATIETRITDYDWAPDGKSLWALTQDYNPARYRVLSFDYRTGKLIGEIVAGTDNINSLQLRHGTDEFYLGDAAGGLNLVERRTGKLVGQKANGNSVRKFSPDGRWWLARSLNNATLEIFSMDDGRVGALASPPALLLLNKIAWSPQDDRIVTNLNRSIAIWELRPKPSARSFGSHPASVNALSWEPSGKNLISGSNATIPLRLWNPDTGVVVRDLSELQKQGQTEAFNAAFSSDGKCFAANGRNNQIGLWDATTYEFKEILKFDAPLNWSSIQFIGKPSTLAVRDKRWNADTRKWEPLSDKDRWYSPDGRLGVRNADRKMTIQQITNGETKNCEQPSGELQGGNLFAWSADSKRFVNDCVRGKLALYSSDGKILNYLTLPTSPALAFEFAPNGSPRLAAVSSDLTLRIWNTDTGAQQFCGVQLSSDQVAITNEIGEVVFGDADTVEKEIIYFIETDAGKTEVLTPAQFRTFRQDLFTLADKNGIKPAAATPPLAVAPFTTAQARAHQEAWAKHLGTQVETVNSVGQKMVLIPPGEFLMGSSDDDVALALKIAEETKLDSPGVQRIQEERPQHLVRITKPFRLGIHEVTIGQFAKFIEQSGYKTQAEEFGGNSDVTKSDDPRVTPESKKLNWRTPGEDVGENSPVTQVSWNDAVAFCNWLSEQEKLEPSYVRDGASWSLVAQPRGYRLPTEAEWEYACRAGTTTQYSFGDDWNEHDKFGWSNTNTGGRPRGAGLLPANPFSLYDMHGNVWEWCHDWYDGKYNLRSPSEDPRGPPGASSRVYRGGGWRNTPANSRSSYRSINYPAARHNDRGSVSP